MELIGYALVLRENRAITQVFDIKRFQGIKSGGIIEWE